MKQMLSLDFKTIARTLVWEAAFLVLLSVVLTFATTSNAYALPAGIAAMIPMVFTFTLFATDEGNGWERFRLALPLSRADIVRGRYATGVALAGIGIATAVIAIVVALALASTVPSLPNADEITRMSPENAVESAAVLLTSASCTLLLLAIMLPLMFKFGMTTGARFTPLIIVVLVVAAVLVLDSGAFGPNTAPVFELIFSSPESILVAAVATFALSFAIYCASALLSYRLYRNREL